jgi:hypothetical protein
VELVGFDPTSLGHSHRPFVIAQRGDHGLGALPLRYSTPWDVPDGQLIIHESRKCTRSPVPVCIAATLDQFGRIHMVVFDATDHVSLDHDP